MRSSIPNHHRIGADCPLDGPSAPDSRRGAMSRVSRSAAARLRSGTTRRWLDMALPVHIRGVIRFYGPRRRGWHHPTSRRPGHTGEVVSRHIRAESVPDRWMVSMYEPGARAKRVASCHPLAAVRLVWMPPDAYRRESRPGRAAGRSRKRSFSLSRTRPRLSESRARNGSALVQCPLAPLPSSLFRSDAMTSPDRREFLAASALSGGLARLPQRPPRGRGRRRQARPQPRPPRLRHRTARAAARRDAARQAPRRGRQPRQEGAGLPRRAGGAAARRRAEHPAAAERRLQVPRGAGRQLRAPGQRWPARTASAGCRSSGRSTTSRASQAQNHEGERLADEAGRRDEGAAAAQGARRRSPTAMDNWDVEAADVAVAALARHCEAGELFDLFARYGCRDFRDIGHKTIYVANAFRTLRGDRLAPRRAGAAVAGLRDPQARRQEPGEGGPGRPTGPGRKNARARPRCTSTRGRAATGSRPR